MILLLIRPNRSFNEQLLWNSSNIISPTLDLTHRNRHASAWFSQSSSAIVNLVHNLTADVVSIDGCVRHHAMRWVSDDFYCESVWVCCGVLCRDYDHRRNSVIADVHSKGVFDFGNHMSILLDQFGSPSVAFFTWLETKVYIPFEFAFVLGDHFHCDQHHSSMSIVTTCMV